MLWFLEVAALAAMFCWAHGAFERIGFKYGHRQQPPRNTLRSCSAWLANTIAAVVFVVASIGAGGLYHNDHASHLFVLIGLLISPVELLLYREWARRHAKDLRIQS